MPVEILPAPVEAARIVVHSTAPKFWKGESDLTFRYRRVFELMKQRGVITLNANWGYVGIKTVKHRERGMKPFVNRMNVAFNPPQAGLKLQISPEMLIDSASLSWQEVLLNQGSEQQVVNLMKRTDAELATSAKNSFSASLFKNGPDYPGEFGGLDGGFQAGATVAADIVVKPTGSYAGQSYTLGDQGGTCTSKKTVKPNASISTDWPQGQISSDYDPLTGLHLNTTSTSWNSGPLFEDNVEEVMSYMHVAQMKRCGKELQAGGKPLNLFDAEYYLAFKNYFRKRNQQIVEVKDGTDVGMPDYLLFDGHEISMDTDVAPRTGYYLQPEKMEFMSPQSQLFEHEGPTWHQQLQAFLFDVKASGNFFFYFRYQGKYSEVA